MHNNNTADGVGFKYPFPVFYFCLHIGDWRGRDEKRLNISAGIKSGGDHSPWETCPAPVPTVYMTPN